MTVTNEIKCYACEDNPKAPNIPCAICGAAALAAAPVGVTVKPLVWEEAGARLRARAGDREYLLNITADGKSWAGGTRPYAPEVNLTWSSIKDCAFVTLDAAKSAAQADFERRILSALTTPPADREEIERLNELKDRLYLRLHHDEETINGLEARAAAAEVRVKALEGDASVLLSQIEALQEAAGHRLEGEDATVVEAIRAALKGGEDNG
ncbi:hypothetical protein [Gellertiella hungarica]|uniref:Uncharacterized protein n=1 Tax=Gellertiella hungarica TaxID=1572859 RepID=A0A7W6JAE2_9HYPH|nr:hypothetical protein [Gellertiella hungarica]MBB4066798.1 hypothetical protein [Gellertiella hungarica]